MVGLVGMSEKPFVIKARKAAREPLYMRLAPETIKQLADLEKETGVNRSEIVQQAIDYAIKRLEIQ